MSGKRTLIKGYNGVLRVKFVWNADYYPYYPVYPVMRLKKPRAETHLAIGKLPAVNIAQILPPTLSTVQ